MKKYLCNSMEPCKNNVSGYCSLIPGACNMQWSAPSTRQIQECCLCSHRKVCKYREEFEEKKNSTYIKLECKYFTN
jgi:hypothetical protein